LEVWGEGRFVGKNPIRVREWRGPTVRRGEGVRW